MRLPDSNRFPAACFRHRRRPRENLHRCERCTFPDFFAAYEKNLDALSRLFGGAYWTRTSDPIDVNDVLYQLSQSTIEYVNQFCVFPHVTFMERGAPDLAQLTWNSTYYSTAVPACQPLVPYFFAALH